MAPQKHLRRSISPIFGPTMSATPQFGVQIGPSLAPYRQHQKPDDGRKGAYNVNKTPPPSHKVPRITRAKAKKTPMYSVSLIAIELKGLAAPGEALKNKTLGKQ